jgi:hypothetical protein
MTCSNAARLAKALPHPAPGPRSPLPTSRVVLILYAFTATANVMASANAHTSLFWATQPLLMPLLVGVAWFTRQETGRAADRRDHVVIAGLLLAAAGNIGLMVDHPVAAGTALGLWAAGLACYLWAFSRGRASVGWRVLLGAALSVASGLLLAAGLAGVTLPGPPIFVPLTALVGQCLIVTGWAPARATSLQQIVA